MTVHQKPIDYAAPGFRDQHRPDPAVYEREVMKLLSRARTEVTCLREAYEKLAFDLRDARFRLEEARQELHLMRWTAGILAALCAVLTVIVWWAV